MQFYVLNAIFNRDMTELLVIKKNRPDWQAGKFNLIGGKIEDDESINNAVIRETHEECGISLDNDDAQLAGVIYDRFKEKFFIGCYVSVTDDIYWYASNTDETVYLVSLDELRLVPEDERVENLLSIVELSKSCFKSGSKFTLCY